MKVIIEHVNFWDGTGVEHTAIVGRPLKSLAFAAGFGNVIQIDITDGEPAVLQFPDNSIVVIPWESLVEWSTVRTDEVNPEK